MTVAPTIDPFEQWLRIAEADPKLWELARLTTRQIPIVTPGSQEEVADDGPKWWQLSQWSTGRRCVGIALIVLPSAVLAGLALRDVGSGRGVFWLGVAAGWLAVWAFVLTFLALEESRRLARLERRWSFEAKWQTREMSKARIDADRLLADYLAKLPRQDRFRSFLELRGTGTMTMRVQGSAALTVLNVLEEMAEGALEGHWDRDYALRVWGPTMLDWRHKWSSRAAFAGNGGIGVGDGADQWCPCRWFTGAPLVAFGGTRQGGPPRRAAMRLAAAVSGQRVRA